jgi:flagellar protein FlaJ
VTLERRDDPTRATGQERYGEDITEQVAGSGYHQRVALVLSQVFHPVYRLLFAGRGHFVSRLEMRLAQAKLSTPVEIYLSNALALGTLLGGLFGSGVGVLALTVLGRPGLPATLAPPDTGWGEALGLALSALGHGLFVGAWFTLFAVFGLLVGLLVAIYYPAAPIYRRRREIDLVMPDVVGFMYSLSVGGMDTLDIFSAVAESEDTYGEAAVEFQQLTHETEYFNVDYQTAVENIARTTPSEELSTFLIDMLSVVNSGGNLTNFLETETEHQIEQRRRKQEDLLNTLEVFGEVYISLTVLPLILVVVLVITSLLGSEQLLMLLVTVYVVLPALNGLYFLTVSVTMQDEVGSGRLDPGERAVAGVTQEGSVRDLGVVDAHVEAWPGERLLHRIRAEELRHRISQLLADPLAVFRASPRYTLTVTAPLAAVVLLALVLQGVAEPSAAAMRQETLTQSFVWFGLPFLLVATPLAVFHEWRERTITSVTDTLTSDLRKLANANATGQPLLEAVRITGAENTSRLGRELTGMYKRVTFGSSLGAVLVEFNNRYRIPRLARSVKLVQKAQETSDQITDVLTTAADLSEIQDDLEREKRTRTRMQVVIIAVSFVVFVAVLLMLEKFFIDTIVGVLGETPDAAFAEFGSLNPSLLSMLYLHAALIQGCCAGVICGYVQTGRTYAGLKYAIGFVGITFLAWALAGFLV